MADESVFRSTVIINIALALPIGLYHRIGSQATGEGLARSEEGVFIMIGVRLCGLLGWVALAAYLINPAWIALGFGLPAHMAAVDRCVFGLFAAPSPLFWTFRSLGKNLTDTVVTRRDHTLVTHGPYRWVRHPFYDLVLLRGLSSSLLTANWLMARLGLSAFAMMVVRTRTEMAPCCVGETSRPAGASTVGPNRRWETDGAGRSPGSGRRDRRRGVSLAPRSDRTGCPANPSHESLGISHHAWRRCRVNRFDPAVPRSIEKGLGRWRDRSLRDQ